MRLPHGANALVVGALAAAVLAVATTSCGDDDGGVSPTTAAAAGATTGSSASSSTTAPPGTSTTASTSASAPSTTGSTDALGSTGATDSTAGAALDGEELAAATAYETVFDSATPLEAKAPYLPDAQALAPTIEAYRAAAARFGGITMDVTAVSIAGNEATATYDVLFGGKPQYRDLTGRLQRVAGGWSLSRDEFCSFMSSARTPCA